MSIVLVGVVALCGLLGLAMVGLGGYAIYESTHKEEAERIFLGSSRTALIVGIIALLAGFCILCAPVFLIFGFALVGTGPY